MNREEALSLVSNEIGDRNLIWFSTVGDDGGPLLDLPQFSHAFCQHAALKDSRINVFSMEARSGRRYPDAESFDFPGAEIVRWLRSAAEKPCLVMSLASSKNMEMLAGRSSKFRYLGISARDYTRVSDKTGVEAALANSGVKVIPWRQLANTPSRIGELRDELKAGPIVVRSSTLQGGGRGHNLILNEDDLEASSLVRRNEIISVAPYLADFMHVSAGPCVFPDGTITKHQACGGVEGVPQCTTHPLGRAANDHSLVQQLSLAALDTLERAVDTVGTWLHSEGYVGAFTYQGRIRGEELYYVEIGPRFGGRSVMTTLADKAMNLPDPNLDHLMAWLGLPSYRMLPMREIAVIQPHDAQVICPNLRGVPVRLKDAGLSLPEGYHAESLPDASVIVEPGGRLCLLRADHGASTDGRSLTEEATRVVAAVIDAFEPVAA